MKAQIACGLLLLAVAARGAAAADAGRSLDLRRGAPPDAYLAIHWKYNPEQEEQREYCQDIWNTVRQTRIIERAVEIAASRMSERDLQKAKSVLADLREAVAPVDAESLMRAKECVYFQAMHFPSTHQAVLIRLTPEAASSCEQAVRNLFRLVEKYSKGKIPVETAQAEGVKMSVLALPKQAPYRPAVARLDDVLLLASSETIARRSLALLQGEQGPSKFDDPRLRNALEKLPEPEDSLIFYDGKLQFQQMRGLADFIRKVGAGKEEAERAAGAIEAVLDEVSILDYEVTVAYTEEHQSRTATYGKLLPDAGPKALAKALGSGRPFENWSRWVPADALAYSLSTGIDLHPLYQAIVELARERIPGGPKALQRWERLQSKYDVYLDRDILQSFSGEHVVVSLPAASFSVLGGQDTFLALRCRNPDRIRELLHRAIEKLQENPYLRAQKFGLAASEELEGFEELSAGFFGVFGARPVIGFRDGWLMFGSTADAVQKILDARAGQGRTIADTEGFRKLKMEIEGPVQTVRYTNVSEGVHRAAKMLNQIGLILPPLLGVAAAQGDAEQIKPIQEALALLPDVARIVRKFDFLEAKLTVTQGGDELGTYLRRTVTQIRPRAAEASKPEGKEGKPKESASPEGGAGQPGADHHSS